MAVLSNEQRFDLWAGYMREFPRDETLGVITKDQLREAINALDQFFSDNAATVNAALPQPARSVLTTKQKALLLIHVIRARYVLEG